MPFNPFTVGKSSLLMRVSNPGLPDQLVRAKPIKLPGLLRPEQKCLKGPLNKNHSNLLSFVKNSRLSQNRKSRPERLCRLIFLLTA